MAWLSRLATLALLGLASLLGGWAHAQSQPDAGALRQQLEGGLRAPLPARARPLEPVAPATLTLAAGEQLTVRGFRFEGHSLLTEEALQAAVAGFLNRPIGFAELQQAAQAVAQAYRDAGWIARTFLPRQDITEGWVTVQIVEARFGGVRLDGSAPQRVPAAQVLAHVQARQKVGDKLSANAIDEGLLLADDLPGVAVSGALEPGERDGETRLALRTTDEPAASGELQLDNSGSRSTGAVRLMAQGQLNSPLRRADQLRAQAVLSEGSRYARLAYDWPLDLKGTRLGVNASAMGYRLVGADFAALGSRGRSTSAGVELSRPLVRTRQQNLYLSAAYDFRRYDNSANGVTQSRYGTDGLVLGLNANRFDDLGGGGATTASLALQHGKLALGSPDPGEEASRAGTFKKLRLSLSRRQAITPKLSLTASLRGQYSNRVLDSSERFYLGGPDGVRAYPGNEGSGSRGLMASAELRWAANDRLAASVFADAGQARDPAGAVAAGPAAAAGSTTLKGVGATVSWAGPKGVMARLTLSRRIGENPNPTATGRDQDGSLVRHRAWVQVSLPF